MKIGTLTYSAEVGSDTRAALASRRLGGLDPLSNIGVDGNPVWPAILGASAEKRQGVVLCASIVDGCWVELLRKVNIKVQEFG